MKCYKTKSIAAVAAMTVTMSGISLSQNIVAPQVVIAEVASFSTGSRIRVDINKNDGRKASYAKNADNWILTDGASDFYEVNGVTFKLSNGGSVGGNVCGANNKKLQLQSGIYPRLTMDGAKIKDGDNGGVLKLEISGLSNENHSL